MFHRLWKDEAGAVISAEIVLVATILVIGMVVGLKSVRDSVVTELADVAQAIANIDQSYSYSGIIGHAAQTTGSFFNDAADFCDVAGKRFTRITLDTDNTASAWWLPRPQQQCERWRDGIAAKRSIHFAASHDRAASLFG
jgi:Flp pilus assembly pilin Flp